MIRVTVEDLETGTKEVAEVNNNVVVICAGTARVTYIQAFKNGTMQYTIKGATEPMRALFNHD